MFELRPYQLTAVENCLTDLKTHDRIGMVAPCGMGKTICFVEMADRYLRETGKAVLILSHLDLLNTQTLDKFTKQKPELKVNIFKNGNTLDWDADIIISTMQTSRGEQNIDRLTSYIKKEIGLIIIDECHLLFCESYDKVFALFPNAKIIGVTASPFRSKSIMTNFFDRISFSISLQQLIDDGYLVPPKLNQILKRSTDIEGICAEVVELYREKEIGSKCIVYMRTIKDTKLLRNIFEDNKIKSRSVTSDILGDERDDILTSFSSGDTKVLISVNVLSLGFDSPCIDCIIMPYCTSSPTLYIQRIGRGLRTNPGKTECRVYVYGSQPSIASKLYERLNKKILYQGTDKECETVEDDMEYRELDTSSEVYLWNKQTFEIIQRMRKMKMDHFADLLNHRKFPPKFMKDINQLLAALPSRQVKVPHGNKPATDNQLTLLFKLGFGSEALSYLTRNEASTMISTLMPKKESWIVEDGMHKGKHVSELPFVYRNIILSKSPASPLANLIRKWNENIKRTKEKKDDQVTLSQH